ncbi:hypothetical protein C7451_11461 [Blastomonas natatoria]|uniref:HEPN domain-containing protein n=1 Tax=Blastomonas natatoria TaxID=34015 RepID=A0A2V3URR1_9SPHN|nr:hypothetical protein [Blastomonas natatoria]PXW70085.1 hypothetical protein C7451_11461 [Blastomonas natatoria]
MSEFAEGAPEIALNDQSLAHLGRAALYEGFAKTALTLCLKALKGLNHEQWVRLERMHFKDIVKAIDQELVRFPLLRPYFEGIKENHERWRERRNFSIHASWGTDTRGKPVANCYRRKTLGDENDVVGAANDCFWLAKEARTFQYQIALLIADGSLTGGGAKGPGGKMRTPTGTVSF